MSADPHAQLRSFVARGLAVPAEWVRALLDDLDRLTRERDEAVAWRDGAPADVVDHVAGILRDAAESLGESGAAILVRGYADDLALQSEGMRDPRPMRERLAEWLGTTALSDGDWSHLDRDDDEDEDEDEDDALTRLTRELADARAMVTTKEIDLIETRSEQTEERAERRALGLALRYAERAFLARDAAALGTVNPTIQPLVDAAMAWVARLQAAAEERYAAGVAAERARVLALARRRAAHHVEFSTREPKCVAEAHYHSACELSVLITEIERDAAAERVEERHAE